MEILMKENDTTRIIQDHHLIYGYRVCRQRKKWYGWKTIIWLYTGQYNTIKGYINHFDWYERVDNIGSKKQF